MRVTLILLLAGLCGAQQGRLKVRGGSGPTVIELKHNEATRREVLNGPTTFPLDTGKWTIRLSQGSHFRPVEREIQILEGETLDFGTDVPTRMVDLSKLGWLGRTMDSSGVGVDEVAKGLWKTYAAANGRIGGIGPVATLPDNFGQLPSFEALGVLRNIGAVTFATSLHSALPFDLVAANLVDGLVMTDGGDHALALWSLLLDHGYQVAPMPGTEAVIYVPCAAGFSGNCVQDAVRNKRTVVSTGPILTANQVGKDRIEVNAWPRQDRPDQLLRVELWAHNQVVATRQMTGTEGRHFTGALSWSPKGANDWIAVRLISESGWAMSSAFFAEEQKAAPTVSTHVKIVFPEIASQQQAGALASIWDFSPGLPGSRRVQEIEMEGNELEADAPVTALVRIELADGRRIGIRLVEASGVNALLTDLAGDALLQWSLYDEVLRRCRRLSIESRF